MLPKKKVWSGKFLCKPIEHTHREPELECFVGKEDNPCSIQALFSL